MCDNIARANAHFASWRRIIIMPWLKSLYPTTSTQKPIFALKYVAIVSNSKNKITRDFHRLYACVRSIRACVETTQSTKILNFFLCLSVFAYEEIVSENILFNLCARYGVCRAYSAKSWSRGNRKDENLIKNDG